MASPSWFNGQYVCFLKWWYPQNTPKWSFLVGKPMGLLGKPTNLGNIHIYFTVMCFFTGRMWMIYAPSEEPSELCWAAAQGAVLKFSKPGGWSSNYFLGVDGILRGTLRFPWHLPVKSCLVKTNSKILKHSGIDHHESPPQKKRPLSTLVQVSFFLQLGNFKSQP